MKKLSDFTDAKGISVAADLLEVILDMLQDKRNTAAKEQKTVLKMFTTFMRNTPDKMMEIFAILSEKPADEYTCNGSEAMENMLILANDPILVSLFISQSQSGDAKSSGSASESTGEN